MQFIQKPKKEKRRAWALQEVMKFSSCNKQQTTNNKTATFKREKK